MTHSEPCQRPNTLTEALDGVDGWLFPAEAAALNAAVHDCVSPQRCLTIVEIGSYMGRSTIALALGLPSATHGTVYAIDPHAGWEAWWRGVDSTFPIWESNIARAGVDDRVEALRCTSADALHRFEASSIDVLFIDGSHSYDDVAFDLTAWAPRVRPGGIMAVHDWSRPGVWRALRALVVTRGSRFAAFSIAESTLLTRARTRDGHQESSMPAALLRCAAALMFGIERAADSLPETARDALIDRPSTPLARQIQLRRWARQSEQRQNVVEPIHEQSHDTPPALRSRLIDEPVPAYYTS